MSEGVAERTRPLVQLIIRWQLLIRLMRLPMPKKTHACATKAFDCNRTLCSNSTGGRYPSAECKRL